MALTIWETFGEANIEPETAAVRRPSPTYPACAGSCPALPPEISAIFEDESVSDRKMTV